MPSNSTSIDALRSPAPREAAMPAVTMGFGSLQSFELMQRAAKLLANSTLVPASYRAVIEKTDYKGNVTSRTDNPNALSNCVVALNMAQRMNADPLMVMQNLYIVEGRPSWSSQWIIAAINGCGRFSPLRFDLKNMGEKEIEYTVSVWKNGSREFQTKKVKVQNMECVAWAIEKETGARIDSPKVSIEMAVKEGWYTKNGSKWQTMPEVMLRYRTASFFGKLYAPELLMGLQSAEEAGEIFDAELVQDGSYAVSVEALRTESAAPAQQTQTSEQPETTDDAGSSLGAETSDAGPTKDELLAAIRSAKNSDELLDLEDMAHSFEGNEADELLDAIGARAEELKRAANSPRRTRNQMTIE